MYLCSHLLCERTAKVIQRGKPWCTAHSLKRFGVTLKEVRAPDTARPLGSATSSGLIPSSERARASASVVDPEPAPLTPEELLTILESDGWHDVEFDLWTRFGVDRNDIERMLERQA